MATVNLANFYPKNEVTDATEVNNNSNALNGSTSGINGENVRSEGIDHKNMNDNPILIYGAQQVNAAANPAFGVAPTTHTGWRYPAVGDPSVPGGVRSAAREYPVNHDATYAINTNVNQGTKLQVNSTNGIALENDMLLKINFSAIIWDITAGTTGGAMWSNNLACNLIGTSNGGTGIGEWCWFFYPKFNTTSSALNDADFKDWKAAGFRTIGLPTDPFNAVEGVTGTSYAFTTRDFSHVAVAPMHTMAAGSGGTDGAIAKCAYYSPLTNPVISSSGPYTVKGEVWVPVDTGGLAGTATGKTLYGIQLFCGGPWRMNSINMALEGDTEANDGIEHGVTITRAQISLQIYGMQGGSV